MKGEIDVALARSLMCVALLVTVLFFTACGSRASHRPPPPRQMFDGVPISGSLADARVAGFTYCIDFTTTMRCRREGVMLMGKGPYSAAVDLMGGDGSGGFDQLTLWHDQDQDAVLDVSALLEGQGWRLCRTSIANRGDQDIYTHPGFKLSISFDVSYFGKRRLRIIPERGGPKPVCVKD